MDYSNHPQTIGEIKSDKTGSSSDWTPRDALISALRDIDSGTIKPEHCLIIFGKVDENGATHTNFYNCTPNRYILMGLLEDHKRRLTVRDATGEY